MRIALVDSNNPKMRGQRLYPLPLLKIGAWRQSLGDDCHIFRSTLPLAGAYDEIWITTLFTFDIPYALGLVREAKNRADKVKVGGVAASLLPEHFEREGVIVHQGLLPDAENFPPDYGLLGEIPEYSITHTSRGCIRKCKFCMVRVLEPEFSDRPGWRADLYPGADTILFYDNNWLAKDAAEFLRDVEELHEVTKTMGIKQIDFNQGLDARLMTEEIADTLIGLPLKPLRFAFDGKQEDGHYQRAVQMMIDRGFTSFRTYVLYNFMDTPEDLYYRLRESVILTAENGASVASFPMRYQPILEVDPKRKYIGKHWTRQALSGFGSIKGASSSKSGIISYHARNTMPPLDEFEYWFGKDADEFVKLINYPQIRKLAQRRKVDLRLRRARGEFNPAMVDMTGGEPELVTE